MRQGYALRRTDGRLMTKPERGPPRPKTMTSKQMKTAAMILDVDHDQWSRFNRFYEEETKSGSVHFAMPQPGNDGRNVLANDGSILTDQNNNPLLITATWLCMFGVNPPVDTVVGVRWRIAFDLVVLPR